MYSGECEKQDKRWNLLTSCTKSEFSALVLNLLSQLSGGCHDESCRFGLGKTVSSSGPETAETVAATTAAVWWSTEPIASRGC